MLQRRLGAELCTWVVTLWSPGITGSTIRRILTSARPKLCCIRCFTSLRVDVYTDNHVLKSALESGGYRSVLKDIFRSCREHNFSLDVCCIRLGENPDDLPSRRRLDVVQL